MQPSYVILLNSADIATLDWITAGRERKFDREVWETIAQSLRKLDNLGFIELDNNNWVLTKAGKAMALNLQTNGIMN